MKAKIIMLLAVFVLIMNSVYAIEINPPIITLEGENGKFVMQSVEIYNDRDEQTIVNISVVGIKNYFLYKTTYVLKPYERKTITIGFTISGSENGLINYEYNGNIITQQVYITSKKSVLIFPPNPKAGSTISIVSPSKMSATGFISCSETGRMYSINIAEGVPFTFINLSKDDYGSAMLLLVWSDGEITYHFFNISKSASTQEGKLDINIDKNIKKGDTKIATLKLGNNNVKGSLIVVKPDGSQVLKDTNDNGQVSITFDASGKWILIGQYKGETVTKSVNVSTSKITIDVDKKVNVGDRMVIKVTPEAGEYEISTPDGRAISDDFDNGEIEFTPDVAGKYEIEVKADGVKEEKTFEAYYNPRIIMKDSNGNFIYSSVKEGRAYQVELVDENTQDYITDINRVDIYRNGMPYGFINLVNGIGSWTPTSAGTYSIVVDYNYATSYEKKVTVYSSSHGGYGYIILSAIGIILIVVAIFRNKIKGVLDEIIKKGPDVPYKP